MSTDLTWKPYHNKTRRLDGDLITLSALENCFGTLPIILGKRHIARLKAIKAEGINSMMDLIIAIHEHGEIKVSLRK